MSTLRKSGSFTSHVRAYDAGQIDLNQFFRNTEQAIRAFSAAILRRWRAPTWVTIDDMAQQFMVGCCWAFKHYDPARAGRVAIEHYVYYNAGDKAKKWFHKQRGARLNGNADASPGRYEVLFVDVTPEYVNDSLVYEPAQERALWIKEQWRLVIDKAPVPSIRWGITALVAAHGERTLAAQVLYENVDARLRLRLSNERAAQKIIARTLVYLRAA